MKKILIGLIMMGIGAVSFGEEADDIVTISDMQIALVSGIDEIVVTDNVTGKCFNYPNRAKDKLEIALRKNGIMKERSSHTATVELIVSGGRKDIGCLVNVNGRLWYPITVKLPSFPNYYSDGFYDVKAAIFWGSTMLAPASFVQKTVEDFASSFGDKVYLMIARARDKTFKKYPKIEEYVKERDTPHTNWVEKAKERNK